MMKRFGILVFYDADGIVDEYLCFLLDHIIEYLDRLVIVCNGNLQDEGRDKLLQYTSNILFRPNEGYDGAAYQAIIAQYLGEIREYDELVLFNDTFFGPFVSFKDIFDEMNRRTHLDFWGITMHPQNGKYVEHLQSYFLAFRKKLVINDDFHAFWNSMEMADDFKSAVVNFEVHLTDYFSQKGYCWESYVNSSELDDEVLNLNYNHNVFSSYDLISKYKSPFLKKKDFSLHSEGRCNLTNALYYVQTKTSYPIHLIWKTILRKYNLRDLYSSINLNHIISCDEYKCENVENDRKRVIAVIELISEDYWNLIEGYFDGLSSFNEICFIINKSCSQEKLARIVNNNLKSKKIIIHYVLEEPKEICWDKIRKITCSADYICFLHNDLTEQENVEKYRREESFKTLWENCVCSKKYVWKVKEHFNNNNSLGLMTSPYIFHSIYKDQYREGWNGYYDSLKAVGKKLGLDKFIVEDKPPVFQASTFWCANRVWETLLARLETIQNSLSFWGISNKLIVSKLLSYLAQSMGLYTENLYTDKYAGSLLQLREDQLRERELFFDKKEKEKRKLEKQIENLQQQLNLQKLQAIPKVYSDIVINQFKAFFVHNPKVYIYGMGMIATRIYDLIRQFEFASINGFIVSEKKQENFQGHKVYTLESLNDINVGIILAVNQKNTNEILPLLIAKGYRNIFCYSVADYNIGDLYKDEIEKLQNEIQKLKS